MRTRTTRFSSAIIAALLLLASYPLQCDHGAFIAIIIDDIGHNLERGELAIDLPGHLTYAVIPETKHSRELAEYAHGAGKEVMVHLPMENTHDQPLGALALTSGLEETEYEAVVARAIEGVPHAAGLNNHMGSALTQEPQAMTWLMRAVKRHRLFFVDSRTTPNTVASEVATRENIMTASRDVFLDNEASIYAIDRQFQELLQLARQRGTAIAIGHPYPETLEYLERAIPQLAAEGIYVVPVSSIMRMRRSAQLMASVGAE